jgi:hypothetical protein
MKTLIANKCPTPASTEWRDRPNVETFGNAAGVRCGPGVPTGTHSMSSGRMRSNRTRLVHGSTLVEAMVACLIVSLCFTSIYAGGSRALLILKSSGEGTSATQLVMNLEEQIRTSTWAEITDPTYLSGTILANSKAYGHLANVTQTILVNPNPIPSGYGSPPIGGQTIEVVCDSSGVVSTPYAGNGNLPTQGSIRVDISLNWNATFGGTPQSRMVSLILSPGGVLGQN